MFNSHVLQGKMRQAKGGMFRQVAKVTEDREGQLLGSLQQIIGVLEERYGYGKADATKALHQFIDEHADDVLDFISQRTPVEIRRKKPQRGWHLLTFAGLGLGAVLLTRWVSRFTSAEFGEYSAAEPLSPSSTADADTTDVDMEANGQ